MNAQEFISAWLEFISHFLKDKSLAEAWYDKTAWTHGTIGPAHAWGDESPFGKHLVDRLGEPWRFWKEYRDIDLALSRHRNLPRPYLWTVDDEAEWEPLFYPEVLDIVIEHEDSCGISWQEMIKLIHVRAPLKVLITYTSEVGIRTENMEHSLSLIERTRSMFLDMIQQVWNTFQEDPSTTYLLIIGQLDERDVQPRLVWYHSIYTYASGTIQAVHQPTDQQPS